LQEVAECLKTSESFGKFRQKLNAFQTLKIKDFHSNRIKPQDFKISTKIFRRFIKL
jgi:hypothetical protein